MKKIITIAIAVLISSAAFAQKETVYGVKYHRDVRLTSAEKVHTEINFGGHYTLKTPNAYGIDLSVSRIYTPRKYFAWGWGAIATPEYNQDYGAKTDLMGKIGIRFGNVISLDLDALAGAGQMPFYNVSASATAISRHYETIWLPTVGGQVAINFRFSKVVGLSIFGRYNHYFGYENSGSYTEAEGWIAQATKYHSDKLSVGASLMFNLYKERTFSGDYCWHGGTYYGYSFMGNEGAIAGVELYHTKRLGARAIRVVGLGTEQTFGEQTSTNLTFGKFGYQIIANGSETVLIPEFAIEAGLGEYAKNIEGSASNDYSFSKEICAPAIAGRLHLGVNLHMGRHNIKLAGKVGYHTCFAMTAESETLTLETSESKLHGFDVAATIGYSFAF